MGGTPAGPASVAGAAGGRATATRITRGTKRSSSTTPMAGLGPDSHHIQASPDFAGTEKVNCPSTPPWNAVHATEDVRFRNCGSHRTDVVLGRLESKPLSR